jgi:hypothetical protein
MPGIPNYKQTTLDSIPNVHLIRLDENIASALAMVSMLQIALVNRLHVAVSAIVDDSPRWGGVAPLVTDIRIIGPGGTFEAYWGA